MSHVMCHNCFVGSQTFHSSHIHYGVCVRVHIVSHDTIECGVMWNSIQLHLHGIHIHMGLLLNCGFT